LLQTDMVTVFGKVKFGNWAGPLGDQYTNQNVYSREHSVLAQWRNGALLNVWPKANAETAYIFPDNTVTRQLPPEIPARESGGDFVTDSAWKAVPRASSAAS